MRTSVLIGDDRWIARRLSRLDVEFGLRWVSADAAESVELVVIDLAAQGAIDEVRQARRRWPTAIVAGYVTVPEPEIWIAGQRAGCDLVANRGALTARLRPLLAGAETGRRTFPVLDEADLAGRLGLVARLGDTPLGPVAIYQIDGVVHAVADRCPHAGASLSEGELERTADHLPAARQPVRCVHRRANAWTGRYRHRDLPRGHRRRPSRDNR